MKNSIVKIIAAWGFGSWLALAQNVAPVQTYYVPMDESYLRDFLAAIDTAGSYAGSDIYNYISIVAIADDTLIYWDQAEDGYEYDFSNPQDLYSITNLDGTQIWGDGDASNGAPPGITNDLISAGTVIKIIETVPDPLPANSIYYGSGDKVGASKPVAMVRGGLSNVRGSLHAGGVELYDTSSWSLDYIVPVGTDTANDASMFEYVGAFVQAKDDGTTVSIDRDADGSNDLTVSLNEGDSYFVDALQEGATISANFPIEVDLLTGDVGSTYEARFFPLSPLSDWSDRYISPVGTPEGITNASIGQTELWIYNPSNADFDVTVESRDGSGALVTTVETITAGDAVGIELPASNTGLRAYSAGNTFYAFITADAGGQLSDWGFSLLSEDSLSSQVLVGQGLGADPSTGGTVNKSPVWITLVGNGESNETVYVDYDADPLTGAFTDPNGNKYDASFDLKELESVRAFDVDGDQTGALIYVLNTDVKISAAWGQDPSLTVSSGPGLDLGTGVPPLPSFEALKQSVLLSDLDQNGYVSPGDILQYEIKMENTSRLPVPELTVSDNLPDSVIYQSNTTYFVSGTSTNAIPDDISTNTAFPIDLESPANDPFDIAAFDATIGGSGNLLVGDEWSILYEVEVKDYAGLAGETQIVNAAQVEALNTEILLETVEPIRGAIGGFVWYDEDENGLQGASVLETAGENGIVVNLLDSAGNPVLDDNGIAITTVTATNAAGDAGYYLFEGIVAGDYIVEFALPNASYTFTLQDQGGDDELDSDVAATTSQISAFTLGGGEIRTQLDAGVYAQLSIGDRVWVDDDADGIQDASETTGLSGVEVILYDNSSGLALATDVTDAAGNYLFTGLHRGDYYVEFVPSSLSNGFTFTASNLGSDDSVDSDADQSTGQAASTGFIDEDELSFDAGVYFVQPELSIVKSVSPSGPVLPGQILTYTITVANIGNSLQENIILQDPLPGGISYVAATTTLEYPVGTSDNVADDFSSANYAGSTGSGSWSTDWVEEDPYGNYVFVENERLRIHWAYVDDESIERSADLSGATQASLSFDWETEGLDAGETLSLLISSTGAAPWATLTNFSGAATGTYSEDISAYISATTVIRFINQSTDWEENENFYFDNVSIDFSDLTTVYADNSGSVNTQLVDGAAANLLTVGDGVDLPVGQSATITFQTVVDADLAIPEIVNTATVTSDQQLTELTDSAISELTKATIGSRFWFDDNGDGIQDASETNGIAGVTVTLVDTNGNFIAQTTTDALGDYLFEDVDPGAYRVQFDLTASTNAWVQVTLQDEGSDDDADSDAPAGPINVVIETGDVVLPSGVTNLTVDVGITYADSTRAEIAQVSGEWRDGQGFIVWETGSEWNTAGFFVYRIDSETGAETVLNDELIPSAFFAQGSSYEWLDAQAVENGAASIRLEEVELTGSILDLGTYDITYEEPITAPVRAFAARMALATEAVEEVEPSKVLKLFVRDAGLVGVSLETLAEGFGRDVQEVEALAALNELNLTRDGESVPVWYDAAFGRLVFYGEPTDSWYARDAAYLIAEGTGLAMTRREPDATTGERIFPVTLRTEEDHYPLDSLSSRPDDFYYWNYILSEHPSLGQKDYALDLSGFAGSELTLTVSLRGWSETSRDPDHHVEFLLNGTDIGSVQFDGKEVVDASLTVSDAIVQPGINTLTVKGVLPEKGTVPDRVRYSYFVVNWIDASFERELVPTTDGSAIFRAGAASSVSSASFVDPIVVAVSDAGLHERIASADGQVVAWNAAVSNEQFAVIESVNLPMLDVAPATETAWFLSETNRIDYLVITSRDLEPAAQELATYRRSQGLSVGVATYEDICDLITHGLNTPEAVPALLRYANETWQSAPWMVVLAGSGHTDYLQAVSSEANSVPPLLTSTQDGLFAADGLLTDIDGDRVPDIAIGRLPALTQQELNAMIDKIKAYEAGFGSAKGNQLVFASDLSDAAGDFEQSNQAMAQFAGPNHSVEQLILDELGVSAARSQLIEHFNDGVGFIHYTGHGGMNNFSGQGLLQSADVNAMLSSDASPVLVALSCLVGRYETPGVTGLSETLLRKVNGGAVAIWGPSGLSRNAPAVELGEAFYQAVLQQGSGTLGLAIHSALTSLDRDHLSEDTLAMYNLLGDPALRIAGNTEEQSSDDSFAKWKWQRTDPSQIDVQGLEQFEEYVGGIPELALINGELQWQTDSLRDDVNYQVLISTNLVDWQAIDLGAPRHVNGRAIRDISELFEREEQSLFMVLEATEK